MSDKKNYLAVICPTCGAWTKKECTHTKGSKEGRRRSKPHDDRVKLAKVKLSESAKKRLDAAEESLPAKKKSPKEKLTMEQKEVVDVISEKISALGKHADFVGPVTVGPIISTYRFLPFKRTKVAHIETMSKDFAVSLGSDEPILVKRMPGESAVGVFVPNKERLEVEFPGTLANVITFMNKPTKDGHLKIPLNFGIDSNGYPFVDDLTQLPHLLMAGTTGSGKSTLGHGVVMSMGWALPPKQLQMIISDTKGVEYKMFAQLPHLKFPICTNVYKTMEALAWCIEETQSRLDKFAMKSVRNIHEFNKITPEGERIPFVVLIIDELADIMGPQLDRADAQSNSGKLSLVVGRSRASGIYCIGCTQRPDVRQIRGQIKANFPARISFRLPSHQDSRTILNTKGAENLMMQGDMLYISSTNPELRRLHAAHTKLEDVRTTIEAILQRHGVQDPAAVVKQQEERRYPKVN